MSQASDLPLLPQFHTGDALSPIHLLELFLWQFHLCVFPRSLGFICFVTTNLSLQGLHLI